MTVASIDQPDAPELFIADSGKQRRLVTGSQPTVLGEIYQEEANIVIWQRELSASLRESIAKFVAAKPGFQDSFTVTPKCALKSIRNSLAGTGQAELSENIAELVEMFCCLFELERAGLRLGTLDHAMCPRFHVDKVPCRLVTTYSGVATEWLPHQAVNRARLGVLSGGRPDDQTGLYQSSSDIQQLSCGDVALLKGELWEGNENAGLVHRSPSVEADDRRLLLTLDFAG